MKPSPWWLRLCNLLITPSRARNKALKLHFHHGLLAVKRLPSRNNSPAELELDVREPDELNPRNGPIGRRFAARNETVSLAVAAL